METFSPRLSEMVSTSNNLICCSHKPSTFSGNDISQALSHTWMWYRSLFLYHESQIHLVTVGQITHGKNPRLRISSTLTVGLWWAAKWRRPQIIAPTTHCATKANSGTCQVLQKQPPVFHLPGKNLPSGRMEFIIIIVPTIPWGSQRKL